MSDYSNDEVRKRIDHCREAGGLELDLSSTSSGDADLIHIRAFHSLTTLNLNYTKVTDAGLAYLKELKSLATLNLYGTSVTDNGLRHLKELKSLTTLQLAKGQVGAGLDQLKDLPVLTVLDLMSARVTDAQLVHLKNFRFLKTLDLTMNGITSDGVACFESLKSLTALNLSSTNITDVGLACLKNLELLSNLDLSYTRMTEAGLVHLQGLHRLTTLKMTAVRISGAGLKWLKNLRNLTTLHLDYAKLNDSAQLLALLAELLPTAITERVPGGKLTKLILWENFDLGLDDRELNTDDPATHYRALLARLDAEPRPLHEIKVVIIGDGGVGKSNLLDRLMGRRPPEIRDRTHDFNVEHLTLNLPHPDGNVAVTFRFFDFGGQPELHGAHRFFLSGSRNIYLLVNRCGGASRSTSRINYWTGLIAFYGKQAPALIVQSWCDKPVAPEWKLVTEQSLGRRNARFPFKVALLEGYYDGKSPEGREIKDLLVKIASEMEYVFTVTYEPGFFRLKRWLEQDADAFPNSRPFERYCSVEQFRENCVVAGISKPARQNDLLEMFGDLGWLLYVGKLPRVNNVSGHALKHWIFNPQWIKGPVYRVIRDTPLATTHGYIGRADAVQRITGCYPAVSETEADNIIALMEVCGLIFRMENVHGVAEGYLVVDQLPASDPAAPAAEAYENWGPEVPFLCDFLGEHVLPRLIGLWRERLLGLTSYTFRDRVIFKHRTDMTVHALVKADVINSRITIRTRGVGQSGQKQDQLRDEIENDLRRLIAQDEGIMGERGNSAESDKDNLTRAQRECKKAYQWAEENIEDFDLCDTWEAKFSEIKKCLFSTEVVLPASAETFARHCQAAGIHLRQNRVLP